MVEYLVTALPKGETDPDALSLSSGAQEIMEAAFSDGEGVEFEIYSASGFERVRVFDDLIQRGVNGTGAISWPAGACIGEVEVIPCVAAIAGAGDGGGSTSTAGPEATLAELGIKLGKGLKLENGVLQLDVSGVSPGNYAGLNVDECGRVTSVDEGFPTRIDTDPCCKG